MFSTTVDLSSHWDMRGLAAARMEVLALSVQMIPALAMDRVCCSWSKRHGVQLYHPHHNSGSISVMQ